jgi:transposase
MKTNDSTPSSLAPLSESINNGEAIGAAANAPRVRRYGLPQRQLSQRDVTILRAHFKEAPSSVGIRGDRWSPSRVATLLRTQYGINYSPRHAVRVLRGLGLKLDFKRAREPRLDTATVARLREVLQHAPREVGLSGDSWTRARLAQIIHREFGVHYSPQYAGRLVQPLGLGVSIARRERRLSQAQADELKQLLETPPSAHGLNYTRWTRASIAALIEQRYGVHYHLHSIQRLLCRWHIVRENAAQSRILSRLSKEQLNELRTLLNGTPRDCGMSGNVWTQQRVAQLIEARFNVRYRAYTLNRTLARLNLQPQHRAERGGAPALNRAQIGALLNAINNPPQVSGRNIPRWTRQEISSFISQQFQVNYAPASVPRLLRRLGVRLVRRAPLTLKTRTDLSNKPGFRDRAPLLSGGALNR